MNFLSNNLFDVVILNNIWILWVPDFNRTNNFIKILNFNHSFVDVNADVSYCNSHKFPHNIFLYWLFCKTSLGYCALSIRQCLQSVTVFQYRINK